MLIAIVVLLVVIIATSSIFSTAQRVSSLGEANSDILQQANAIERVIRNDFKRISRDGFFAVQCVGVPNNINGSPGSSTGTGRLLDPTRDEFEEIRSDQLFFFTEGLAASTRALDSYANASSDQVGLDKAAPAQSYFSSVFYSPGVQVKIQPYQNDPTGGDILDIDRERLENTLDEGLYPWSSIPAGDLPFQRWPSAANAASTVPLIPESTENWILCRQSTLLGDDDGSRDTGGGDAGNTGDYYMSGDNESDPNSAPSVFYNTPEGLRFQPSLINSRVDIAATERDTLRQEVCHFWNDPSDWGFQNSNQRGDSKFFESPTDLVKTNQVLEAMYYGYPRGELRAPSMQRMDTMLTNAVLGPNISDFRVEWTWADGVGRDKDVSFDDNQQKLLGGLPGVVVEGTVLVYGGSTPWFGLSDETIGSAPASAFMSGSQAPDDAGGCSGWSHIGDPGRRATSGGGAGGDAVRIGPPVGTEIGSGPPYFLDDPFGVQTDETLAHIEYGEGAGCDPGDRIRRYGAVFGFNGENAILRAPTGEPYVFNESTPGLGSRIVGSGNNGRGVSTYTPWPTAVRISFRLHDSEARLEGGRLFEFIIPLPRADS
jgi:hypothetical protein